MSEPKLKNSIYCPVCSRKMMHFVLKKKINQCYSCGTEYDLEGNLLKKRSFMICGSCSGRSVKFREA